MGTAVVPADAPRATAVTVCRTRASGLLQTLRWQADDVETPDAPPCQNLGSPDYGGSPRSSGAEVAAACRAAPAQKAPWVVESWGWIELLREQDPWSLVVPHASKGTTTVLPRNRCCRLASASEAAPRPRSRPLEPAWTKRDGETEEASMSCHAAWTQAPALVVAAHPLAPLASEICWPSSPAPGP